ncbi:MAG: flavin reductase family protein [Neisseria sp.]|nr:flavin reductase family protein [Neisseria sp.]
MYQPFPLNFVFTLIEPSPVVLISTRDQGKDNVFTLSWLMPLGFDDDGSSNIAIMTGGWNHSAHALLKNKQCVVHIPTAGQMETVIAIGTVSGADTDKFTQFGLKSEEAHAINCPIIQGCAAYIECRVADYIEQHGIVVLQPVAAGADPLENQQPKFHAVGDGRFFTAGQVYDYRRLMWNKLPPQCQTESEAAQQP